MIRFIVITEFKWRLVLQDLDIPDHMKELYKTVWEIKQKVCTWCKCRLLSVLSAQEALRCAAS